MKTRTSWENQDDPTFEANKYYRYRILNNGLGDTMYGRFVDFEQDCENPLSPALPFYILGADSSLFHETIYYDSNKLFKLGAAERI